MPQPYIRNTPLIQSFRPLTMEGESLLSVKCTRMGVGRRKLVLKGSQSEHAISNVGRGKWIEYLSIEYGGLGSPTPCVLFFFVRGDYDDLFSDPSDVDRYQLVGEFSVGDDLIQFPFGDTQPVNLFLPPYYDLYAATSDGAAWNLSLYGLDYDWVYDPPAGSPSSGDGDVVSYTGLRYIQSTYTVYPLLAVALN